MFHPIYQDQLLSNTLTFIGYCSLMGFILDKTKPLNMALGHNIFNRGIEAFVNTLVTNLIHKDCYQLKYVFSEKFIQQLHLNGDEYLFRSNFFINAMLSMGRQYTNIALLAVSDTLIASLPLKALFPKMGLKPLSLEQANNLFPIKLIVTYLSMCALVVSGLRFQSSHEAVHSFRKISLISNLIYATAVLTYRFILSKNIFNEFKIFSQKNKFENNYPKLNLAAAVNTAAACLTLIFYLSRSR